MADVRNRKEAQGRHVLGMMLDRNGGSVDSGIVFSQGPFHETTKKFVFGNLHKMGLSKYGGLETIAHERVSEIVRDWRSRIVNNFAIIDDLPSLGKYASSIVMGLILGDKLDTPKFKIHLDNSILATIEYINAGVVGTGLDQALPFLGALFPSLVGKDIALRTTGVIRDMAQDLLNELRKDRKTGQNGNGSLAELYLDKIETKEDPEIFTDFHFQTLFADILAATYETQSSTLQCLLLFSILHTDAQNRIFEEIKASIGRDEPVRMEHRKM